MNSKRLNRAHRWALLAMAVMAMTGCSTTPGIKAEIAGANIEIAKQRAQTAAMPIVNLQMPIQGCTAPDPMPKAGNPCMISLVVHAPQGGSNAQVSMPEDPAWRTAESAVRMLGTGLNFWLGGQAAVGLIEAGSTGIVNALKAQPAPTVVTQPAPVIVQPADPIIVEQPAPVIVTQPEPIVIEQPAPIIVNQPVLAP